MHDFAGVGITVATILAASFFSNQSVNTLGAEVRSELNCLRSGMTGRIDSLRSEMVTKLDSIQKDMREFCAEQARHDLRITTLEQEHKN